MNNTEWLVAGYAVGKYTGVFIYYLSIKLVRRILER
jgi:hypothetical protein